ncbi:MAG: hypothetical protein ACR5KV_06265 [Wolbachia sp.]
MASLKFCLQSLEKIDDKPETYLNYPIMDKQHKGYVRQFPPEVV